MDRRPAVPGATEEFLLMTCYQCLDLAERLAAPACDGRNDVEIALVAMELRLQRALGAEEPLGRYVRTEGSFGRGPASRVPDAGDVVDACRELLTHLAEAGVGGSDDFCAHIGDAERPIQHSASADVSERAQRISDVVFDDLPEPPSLIPVLRAVGAVQEALAAAETRISDANAMLEQVRAAPETVEDLRRCEVALESQVASGVPGAEGELEDVRRDIKHVQNGHPWRVSSLSAARTARDAAVADALQELTLDARLHEAVGAARCLSPATVRQRRAAAATRLRQEAVRVLKGEVADDEAAAWVDLPGLHPEPGLPRIQVNAAAWPDGA